MVVDRERVLVTMSRASPRCATLDTSWKISILMALPSVICGLMRRVRPTSWRRMVWNGFSTAVPWLIWE